jgi:hypothetical protein
MNTETPIVATLSECATVRSTWKQLEKKLAGAAKGTPTYSHKPTNAHPYARCFGAPDKYGSTRMHRHEETVPMTFEGRTYDRPVTCEEYIRQCEADKALQAACSHSAATVYRPASRWDAETSDCHTCGAHWQSAPKLAA